jgi:hypothetical protein
MKHCQRLPCSELLQVEARVAQGKAFQAHDQPDHTRVALQAQRQEIGDAERIGHRLSLGKELPTPYQHLHPRIRLQVAEPVRLRAASGAYIIIIPHLFVLQWRLAWQAGLTPGGGKDKDDPSGTAPGGNQADDEAAYAAHKAPNEGGAIILCVHEFASLTI